jgi:hypothetical protein
LLQRRTYKSDPFSRDSCGYGEALISGELKLLALDLGQIVWRRNSHDISHKTILKRGVGKSMIKLSYSTNGLLNLNLFSAIDAVERAGYNGIELSFDKNQFNPFELNFQDLKKIRDYFGTKNIKPACIATPTIAFLSDRPHEPSVICLG